MVDVERPPRGPYERRDAAEQVPAQEPRAPQIGTVQVCACGAALRVAGAWTCWRCGTCHRRYERTRT